MSRNARIKILLLCQELGQGGTERQVAETAMALDRLRYECQVVCLRSWGYRGEELIAHGIPVREISLRSFWKPSVLQTIVKLRRHLQREEIDLVHSFDAPGNLLLGLTLSLGRPKRLNALCSQRAYRSLAPGWMRLGQRLVDPLMDGVVVNCEAIKQHLINDYSIAESRIEVCYNAIDTTRFHPNIPARQDERIPETALVVGVVCALRPEKDLATLLKAFAQLSRDLLGIQELKLLLVGGGPEQLKLQALSVQLGIAKDFIMVPSTGDVSVWLKRIDIFVLPSVSEALSNSLMEAMACGCASIASRVGGSPELLGEDETRGLLFPAGDVNALREAMHRLAVDEGLRLRLANAASCFIAKQFTRQQAGERMARIYEGFLQRRV